jgi:hypothetical protein
VRVSRPSCWPQTSTKYSLWTGRLPTSMPASNVPPLPPPLPGHVLIPAAHPLFSAQESAAPRCTRRLTSPGRPPAVPPPVRVQPCAHARSSPPLLRAGRGGTAVHAAADELGEAAGGAAPCARAAACSGLVRQAAAGGGILCHSPFH